MKTVLLKPADVKPEWWIVDGTDLVVGRLATKLATMLMGKHRPDYTPHVGAGVFIVVVNAEKLKFTGKKWENKIYDRYTGYPSGRRTMTAEQLRARKPERILQLAIRRMLPKNRLGYQMLRQLKIFGGPEHTHQAQQPKPLKIEL